MSSGPTSRTTAINTSARLRDRTFCVENGTSYGYYDDNLSIQPETAAWASGSRVPPDCSYARPGLFEDWVRSTRHASNEVIAAQWRDVPGICRSKSFGPSEISDPVLDCSGRIFSASWSYQQSISTRSSHDLIVQACLEAGAPRASRHVLRMAHADAGCERYAGKAIKALREALLRVQDSWQNETTLCLNRTLEAHAYFLFRPPRGSQMQSLNSWPPFEKSPLARSESSSGSLTSKTNPGRGVHWPACDYHAAFGGSLHHWANVATNSPWHVIILLAPLNKPIGWQVLRTHHAEGYWNKPMTSRPMTQKTRYRILVWTNRFRLQLGSGLQKKGEHHVSYIAAAITLGVLNIRVLFGAVVSL